MRSRVFDGSEDWKAARLPVIHAEQLLKVLAKFEVQHKTLGMIRDTMECSEMWHETNNQVDGTIKRNVHFPERITDMIFSGPHIMTANPFAKCPRRICELSSDYDVIDLTFIPAPYIFKAQLC